MSQWTVTWHDVYGTPCSLWPIYAETAEAAIAQTVDWLQYAKRLPYIDQRSLRAR